MEIDLKYALKQLRGVAVANGKPARLADAIDRIQRAIDALERIEAALQADKVTPLAQALQASIEDVTKRQNWRCPVLNKLRIDGKRCIHSKGHEGPHEWEGGK